MISGICQGVSENFQAKIPVNRNAETLQSEAMGLHFMRFLCVLSSERAMNDVPIIRRWGIPIPRQQKFIQFIIHQFVHMT